MDERNTLLEQIMAYEFVLIDLQLYLDTHPADKNALRDYKMALDHSENLRRQYQAKYGPLSIRSLPDPNCWQWVNDPWPWNKEA